MVFFALATSLDATCDYRLFEYDVGLKTICFDRIK